MTLETRITKISKYRMAHIYKRSDSSAAPNSYYVMIDDSNGDVRFYLEEDEITKIITAIANLKKELDG